jgi:hypothetical protein
VKLKKRNNVFLRSFAERFDVGFFAVSAIGYVLLLLGLGSLLTLRKPPIFTHLSRMLEQFLGVHDIGYVTSNHLRTE